MGRGRLSPAATGVEASESADSAKDGGCGRFLDVFDLFKHLLDNEGDVFAPKFKETSGGRMAIEDVVGDPVGAGYVAWMAPLDEVGFDEAALGVVADFAFAAVAFER